MRPSKQIRPPLFSTKQKRQRRWIVFKYTLLYIVVISLLVALLVLRKFRRPLLHAEMTDRPDPAPIFKNEITFHCTVCSKI